MPIDFPDSPVNGDSFTSNDKTWQYNGTSWVVIAGSVSIDAGSVTASKLASGAVTNAKLATDAVHSVNIAADSVTTAKIDADAVTTAKIADANITAAKIANNAVTEGKINDGAVTQAKLASGFSGITVTTTANRSAVIPSPFTGQFIFLTDTSQLQRWDGSQWVVAITTVPTGAPTSLALVSVTPGTATISFTAGSDGGSSIINYEFAVSTDGGATFSEYTALPTPDGTSPITITDLTPNTAHQVKLKAVNALGVSAIESSALSFTTESLEVEYLVVAGGGGGSSIIGGGGGAGGYREATSNFSAGTYAVVVGAGGRGGFGYPGSAESEAGFPGFSSSLSNFSSTGGGGARGWGGVPSTYPAGQNPYTKNGGSGGGGSGSANEVGGTGNLGGYTPVEGYAGGNGADPRGAGGGGAGAAGVQVNSTANTTSGGIGRESSITGVATYYAGGGGGGRRRSGAGEGPSLGGNGGGGRGMSGHLFNNAQNGSTNTGGGGGGGNYEGPGAAAQSGGTGGSGVVIARYLTADSAGLTITGGTKVVGPTGAETYTVHTFTASGSLVIA